MFQIVEKLDLIGLDFLWELCLRTTNEEIAESAVNLLMIVSYTNLAARLKRVSTDRGNYNSIKF